MIKFVEKPNLPKGKVKAIVCGELCKELNDYFDSIGIKRIIIEPNYDIDHSVKSHADMAAIHLGDNSILIDNAQVDLYKALKTEGIHINVTDKKIKGEYPYDIGLNFTVIGNNLIGKIAFADNKLAHLTKDYNHISVKQGYCKCSCLVVNENAIITDDESIYNALTKSDFECLLVSKGDVSLPGHEYGFIGGASGKISHNQILFFGDITKHRDYIKIADFITKHNCEIISLEFPLTDFGSVIPVTEEI